MENENTNTTTPSNDLLHYDEIAAAYRTGALSKGSHADGLMHVIEHIKSRITKAISEARAEAQRVGFDQANIAVLVAQARAEGEAAGYSAGFTACQNGEPQHMPG